MSVKSVPKKGYKMVPWYFGKEIEIPEEWGSSKLKEVVILTQGLQVPEENQSSKKLDGYERFLRIVDYQEEIPPRYVEISKRQAITNEKTIVMVRYGAGAGNVYTGLKGVIANNLFQIIPKKDNLKNNFLFIFLKRDFIENYLRNISGTTTMPNINHGLVYNLIILLPPLPEQQKITSILSNVDNLIQNTDKLIEKTIRLKKGLMQELLTRGIGHTKFKKVPWYFGKEIEIPEEWEVKKINELAKINSEQININFKYNEIEYVDISSIEKFQITKLDKYLTSERPSRAQRIIKNKDIIISTVRPYLKSFSLINFDKPNLICSTGFTVVQSKINSDINFLFNYFKSYFFELNYLRKMEGMAYPAITSSVISNSLIPTPNDEKEREKIASILSNTDEKIHSYERYRQKLQNLKTSLMQKLLTGEVRVAV